MDIKIKRTNTKGEITEGRLTIDGQLVCDTLENTLTRLAPGTYPIILVKCKQYARKMICIQQSTMSLIVSDEGCNSCTKQKLVFPNTLLPRHCPMIKPGNGIHGRHDGSILVGTRSCLGCIIHPKPAFDSLYERIRKNLERGRKVTLVIEECP